MERAFGTVYFWLVGYHVTTPLMADGPTDRNDCFTSANRNDPVLFLPVTFVNSSRTSAYIAARSFVFPQTTKRGTIPAARGRAEQSCGAAPCFEPSQLLVLWCHPFLSPYVQHGAALLLRPHRYSFCSPAPGFFFFWSLSFFFFVHSLFGGSALGPKINE